MTRKPKKKTLNDYLEYSCYLRGKNTKWRERERESCGWAWEWYHQQPQTISTPTNLRSPVPQEVGLLLSCCHLLMWFLFFFSFIIIIPSSTDVIPLKNKNWNFHKPITFIPRLPYGTNSVVVYANKINTLRHQFNNPQCAALPLWQSRLGSTTFLP